MNIRCYDNGGESFDRYTVVYLDYPETRPGTYLAIGMSENPFHPQGFGQHCSAGLGNHLGAEISFGTLPEPCQRLVREILEDPQA